MSNSNKWYEIEDDDSNELNYEVKLYDITSSPNDFNVKTYFDFIEVGMVIIPTFKEIMCGI